MQLTVDKGVDWETSLADEPHILNLQGPTCSYQSEGAGPGSSRSICGLAALNYARLSLALEVGDDTPESPLLRLASAETIKASLTAISARSYIDIHYRMQDTMSILEWNELKGITHLNVTELLEVPFFQETLSTKALIEDIRTVNDLEDLFQCVILCQQLFPFPQLISLSRHWFPKFSSQVHAAVFSGNAEALVCLSFSGSYSESLTYSIFDLHSRSDHRDLPAVTFLSDLDDVTARIHSFLSQSSKISDKSAQGSDISGYLLELRERRSSDFKDVLARSATYISRRQMGADDTAPLSFVESDHISQLRLRAERLRKVRSEEYSNPEMLSDITLESRQKRKKHAFGPRRTGEYGWQLSLLLESNLFPITVSEDNKEIRTERKDERPISGAPFGDFQPDSGDSGRDGFGSSSKQKSEYSWLTSIVRKSSIHTVGPFSQGSVKESTPNHSDATEKKDAWQMALSQQLQEEEELSASFSNVVSSDHAWLVTLQKRLQEEDSDSGTIPAFADRSQLDWHLAVQLQQELFRDEDRRPTANSSSQRTRGTNLPDEAVSNRSWVTFPETASWIRFEDSTTFNTIELPRVSLEIRFECGICAEMCQSKERVGLADCDHKFCKECLTTFVKTKIEERRYPIFCPECVTMRTHTTKSR